MSFLILWFSFSFLFTPVQASALRVECLRQPENSITTMFIKHFSKSHDCHLIEIIQITHHSVLPIPTNISLAFLPPKLVDFTWPSYTTSAHEDVMIWKPLQGNEGKCCTALFIKMLSYKVSTHAKKHYTYTSTCILLGHNCLARSLRNLCPLMITSLLPPIQRLSLSSQGENFQVQSWTSISCVYLQLLLILL